MGNNRLVEISIIFIAAVILVGVLKEFQQFLRPFVIAVILSFLFVPLTRFSKEKKVVVGLSTLGIVLTFVISIALIGTFVSDETEQIDPENNAQENTSLISLLTQENLFLEGENMEFSTLVDREKITNFVTSFIQTALSSLSVVLSELLLVALFLMFLLPSHDITVKRVTKGLSEKEAKRFKKALEQIEQSIRDYLSIKSLVSLGTAGATLIVLLLFGVKFAFLFSLMVFILNFIPSIGSFIAVGIIILYELFTGGFSTSLLILSALLILVQFIFGNVLEPKFAGKQLQLSPVIILLSLFFWGAVWGVGGMFFAVPLTSIIKIVLQNVSLTKGFVKYLN